MEAITGIHDFVVVLALLSSWWPREPSKPIARCVN